MWELLRSLDQFRLELIPSHLIPNYIRIWSLRHQRPSYVYKRQLFFLRNLWLFVHLKSTERAFGLARPLSKAKHFLVFILDYRLMLVAIHVDRQVNRRLLCYYASQTRYVETHLSGIDGVWDISNSKIKVLSEFLNSIPGIDSERRRRFAKRTFSDLALILNIDRSGSFGLRALDNDFISIRAFWLIYACINTSCLTQDASKMPKPIDWVYVTRCLFLQFHICAAKLLRKAKLWRKLVFDQTLF